MIYRLANLSDAEQIALFHADSWRRTYRGLFNDDFLDNEADANRKLVWHDRLSVSRDDQFVCLAEADDRVVGFVCAYGGEDAQWGSLIDNLHVMPEYQRQGVGSQLMARAFDWIKATYPEQGVYLWVMENNHRARAFYHKLGAVDAGVVDKPNPAGGGSALTCRYVWSSLSGKG